MYNLPFGTSLTNTGETSMIGFMFGWTTVWEDLRIFYDNDYLIARFQPDIKLIEKGLKIWDWLFWSIKLTEPEHVLNWATIAGTQKRPNKKTATPKRILVFRIAVNLFFGLVEEYSKRKVKRAGTKEVDLTVTVGLRRATWTLGILFLFSFFHSNG